MQLETLGGNLFLASLVIIGIIIAILWKDRDFIRMTFRNLGRRKTRNILTVIGISLSISLYVAFNVAAANATATFLNVIELTGGKVDFEITKIDGEPFDEGILEEVLKVEGVKAAAPRIQRFCIIFVFEDGNSTAAQVIGIDPKYDNEFGDLFDYNTSEPINDLVIGKNAIVSETLIDGLTKKTEDGELVNATVGDSLEIKYRSGSTVKKERWEIAAFAEATGKARDEAFGLSVWIPLDQAQKFFPKTKGKIDRLIVELDPEYSDEFKEVQQRIEDVVKAEDDELEVFAPRQTQLENAQGALIGLNAGTGFAGATVLLAMIFLIFNAINITLAERTYEIGVLRSIGFKRRHIFRLFLYELLAIGVAGSIIGLFIGIGLSRALFRFLTTSVIEFADPTVVKEAGIVTINPSFLRDGFLIGVILTIIAGLYPLVSITRTAIINALRPESRVTKKPTLRSRLKCIIGGIVLLIVGISLFIAVSLFPVLEMSGMLSGLLSAVSLAMAVVGIPQIVCGIKQKYRLFSAGLSLLVVGIVEVLYLRSTGIIGNFVLVAGSIAFTASILRGIGGFFNFFVRRVPGLEYVSELASRNLSRNPARSTLTFGIFTIALSLVITVATITGSVTVGILNFVDSNLEADMFIISQVGAPPTLSGNITQNIQGIHWENTNEGPIPACTVQQQAGARFELWDEDFDSLLVGVNSTNYAVINENTRIIAPNDTDIDTFTLFKKLRNPNENACIISDKLANELKIRYGQKTPIKIRAAGNETEFKVVGIISNNYIGSPQAGFFCIIDIDKFYDFGFEKKANIFTLKLDPYYPNGTDVDPEIVADQIDTKWGDEYKLTFSLKENIKKEIEESTAQIGVFFNIISFASIIVGLLALLTTLIKIVSERRREIGLLRTIGIKRTKVIQLILFESIFLAFVGLILGLIDGYILGASVVRAIAEAGGENFSATLIIPWNAIAFTTGVSIVAAIVAAIFPAWQAGRVAPAESLRYTG